MNLKNYLEKDLSEFVLKSYSETHRHFHTFDHIESILNKLDKKDPNYLVLFYATIFHDIVYDPKSNDNEEKSVEVMKEKIQYQFDYSFIEKVSNIILGTKEIYSDDPLISYFNSLDRQILLKGNVRELIEYGQKIWKEYSFHSYSNFFDGHFELIHKLTGGYNYNNISSYQQYAAGRKLKVGIYPGSFNPFHKGHEYIVNESNKLFDKVIIAKGMNPNKIDVISEFNIKQISIPGMKYFESVEFSAMLSDLVEHYEQEGYDVTIVKGIRNYQDLDSEMTQRKFLNDFKKDLKYVFIPCSEDLNYISSSAIRTLQKFGKDVSQYVP